MTELKHRYGIEGKIWDKESTQMLINTLSPIHQLALIFKQLVTWKYFKTKLFASIIKPDEILFNPFRYPKTLIFAHTAEN